MASDIIIPKEDATENHQEPPKPTHDLEHPRKRTKTGCLTCRRRRIKCGEERPICRNCIKSKRHCDGYNPRVAFRQTDFDYRQVSHGGAHIIFPAGPVSAPPLDASSLGAGYPSHWQQHFNRTAVPNDLSGLRDSAGASIQPHPMPIASLPPLQPGSRMPLGPQTQPSTPFTPDATDVMGSDGHAISPHDIFAEPSLVSRILYQDGQAQPFTPVSSHNLGRGFPTPIGMGSDRVAGPFHVPHQDPYVPPYNAQIIPQTNESASFDMQAFATRPFDPGPQMPWLIASARSHHDTYGATQAPLVDILGEAAVRSVDDDYYDVQPDEMDQEASEDTLTTISPPFISGHNPFSLTGMLDHYRVEQVASPLKNPATARFFAHFISDTGPSLSVFERHVRRTSVLSSRGSVPLSQQSLWTQIMPAMALHSQGLLHAMLALASLHIARTQGGSLTPSMQHYAWALKSVHHSVGHPQHRHKLTTIAASMLLGYYEVTTADHMKWSTHLAGSKQLLSELNFVSMVKRLRQIRREQRLSLQLQPNMTMTDTGVVHSRDKADTVLDINEGVISHLVGREVRYDEHGSIRDNSAPTIDLEQFDALRDLFWWYCKQDAFQALISGNALLLDISRWTDCPPRSTLGATVCGSMDHLVLLLGRLAAFIARDRSRKRQVEARKQSHSSTSRPGTAGATPLRTSPSTSATASNSHGNTPPAGHAPPARGPAFDGMAPSRGDVEMPASYRSNRHSNTGPGGHAAQHMDEATLQAATAAALEEHHQIRAALDTFANHLGPAFQPLTPDHQPPVDTPFGPALFYRSSDISCLWAMYHMAVIIAIRAHPDMPPAAHVAALVAARDTARSANEVGRLVAALAPGPPSRPLNPHFASALNESCVASFFAAVQYQSPVQRHATVSRIYHIAARTGWASSELIASGCETAWINAAAAGFGPPYTRVVRRLESDDPRLNGSWEALDLNAPPDERDEADRRLVAVNPGARLHWAIGVMGLARDVAAMRVDEERR